jgi:hypothetical protein
VARGVRVRASVRGAEARRVDFHVAGRRVARDRRRPFARTLRIGRERARVTARATLANGRRIATTRTARRCSRRSGPRFAG